MRGSCHLLYHQSSKSAQSLRLLLGLQEERTGQPGVHRAAFHSTCRVFIELFTSLSL